jgi:hypothetical protein
MLSISRKVSTRAASALLAWHPRHTSEQAVLAAVDSLSME